MKLQEILRSKIATVSPSDSASAGWDTMKSLGTGYLVVMRDGKVVGVVSRHDLGGPSGGAHRRMGRRIADLMQAEVVTATPRTDIRKAAALMRRKEIGCLPVVERGKLVGMVTVSELLALLERTLTR